MDNQHETPSESRPLRAIQQVVKTQSEHLDVHLQAIRDVKDDIHLLKLHIRVLYVLLVLTTLAALFAEHL